MVKNENYPIKERMVKAVLSGDWETAGTLLHPDFALHEPASLPFGGVYKGLEGFKEFSKIVRTFIKTESIETIRNYFTDDPDYILVEAATKGKVLATGVAYESPVMEEFRFRDGKVLSIMPCWFNIPDFPPRA